MKRSVSDVIVVGSGVGGAVASALLADAGLRVVVVEKNDRVGGVLSRRWRHGFSLDMGSHLLATGDRGPIGWALRRLRLDRPRLLTHPIPVRSRGLFEVTAPADRSGLFRVAMEVVRAMNVPPREVLRLTRLVVQIFTLTEWELERLDRVTLDDYLSRYTDHPGAYFLFSFLASIFYVLPPWEVSAGEALRGLRSVLTAYRLSYVEGGMHALPDALLGVVTANGGRVVTNDAVHSVHETHGLFSVVTTRGRTLEAPAVIMNVSPKDALPLLRDLSLPAAYVERLRGLVPSGAAHQLRVGLSKPLLTEGCMIGGISRSGMKLADLDASLMRSIVKDIRAGRISDPLAVYAPVPTNFDPSLAPNGAQVVVASVYGAPGLEAGAWKSAALDAFAQVIPGFYDHLLFADFTPITAIGGWMGRRDGGAISVGQTPDQVGVARPAVSAPHHGLYFAGDGAGGHGIGMELAARSGIEAAAAVLHAARALRGAA